MSYLFLYAGLLLPWIMGVLSLMALERRCFPRTNGHPFRQIGYGFFLGYAALFIVISICQALIGSVSWPGIMAFMLSLSLAAVWLLHTSSQPAEQAFKKHNGHASKGIYWLTLILMLWIAVHLLTYATDIFTQPLYPWDAWLAWTYRAKAWFLSGEISAVISPAAWLADSGNGRYTIEAWTYPTFPSVVPYWAALSFGQWSETLINVPTLFAGLAIGMGVYGQCREYGLSVFVSILCCYFLYSIPLFGTHIALAGYADIWMAGFTGLGFIALIQALALRDGTIKKPFGLQMTLAFTFLTLALLVKNEAAVWLLTAFAMFVILSFRPRVPILVVVSFGLLFLIGFAFGATHINFPFIGEFGVLNGHLVIPYIGVFALEFHNVWHVYLTNFFSMGSWNLFWLLVLIAIYLAITNRNNTGSNRSQRIACTFILIFFSTQLFIFGLTDQGLWADTFTAINRLPMHFLPALLFAAFITLHDSLPPREVADV